MADEIDIAKLRQIANLIFDHVIDDLGVKTVPISSETDFYWEVPSDQIFAVGEDQPRLDVGRLTDDEEFLASLVNNKERAVALMFIHLAPLLRFLGTKVGQ
ncbi:MAG: hypothetical protein ACREO8_08560 [Luteimonas sp.]